MDVWLGIRKKLSEMDYSMLVSNYEAQAESERSLRGLQVLEKQWVDGIIRVPSDETPANYKLSRKWGFPLCSLTGESRLGL